MADRNALYQSLPWLRRQSSPNFSRFSKNLLDSPPNGFPRQPTSAARGWMAPPIHVSDKMRLERVQSRKTTSLQTLLAVFSNSMFVSLIDSIVIEITYPLQEWQVHAAWPYRWAFEGVEALNKRLETSLRLLGEGGHDLGNALNRFHSLIGLYVQPYRKISDPYFSDLWTNRLPTSILFEANSFAYGRVHETCQKQIFLRGSFEWLEDIIAWGITAEVFSGVTESTTVPTKKFEYARNVRLTFRHDGRSAWGLSWKCLLHLFPLIPAEITSRPPYHDYLLGGQRVERVVLLEDMLLISTNRNRRIEEVELTADWLTKDRTTRVIYA